MTIHQVLKDLQVDCFDWDCVGSYVLSAGFTYEDWEQWINLQ